MLKIAILTTTKPLRQSVQEIGRTLETLSPSKCRDLAEQYDVIVIGSRASDEFYERIKSALPRKLLEKFQLYPRSFFERFKRRGNAPSEYDDRDEGWKEILRANKISFLPKARLIASDFKTDERPFHWTRLADFIRDKRVTVIMD
jgi:hypothetical protein